MLLESRDYESSSRKWCFWKKKLDFWKKNQIFGKYSDLGVISDLGNQFVFWEKFLILKIFVFLKKKGGK